MEMNMKALEMCFQKAKEAGSSHIAIKVQMEGFSQPEIIINPMANADAKLEYYKKAYNDDLVKVGGGIKIINFTHGRDYSHIEDNFLIKELRRQENK